jgi:hypothetical protein
MNNMITWVLIHAKKYKTAILSLVFFSLIFYGPVLVKGTVYYWGLPTLQFYPWRHVAFQSLSRGSLPFWNPFNGMNSPLLANYQLAFFYPPTWILYFFELVGGVGWMAWAHTLVNLAHFLWGGMGMAAVVQKHKGSPLAQTLAAMAFSGCGYFLARQGVFPILWTGAWLPWLVHFVSDIGSPFEKAEEISSKGWLHLPLTACLAIMLLAGHAQLSWYFVWFCGAWVMVGVLIQHKPIGSAALRYIASGLLAGAIAAVQLIPTAEFLLQSQRSGAVDFSTAAAYSFWPWRWITFLAGNFFGNPGTGDYWGYASFWEDAIYIGILPLGLAVAGLIQFFRIKGLPKKRTSLLAAWIGIILVAIFAMGKFTPVYPFLYKFLPSVDMFHAPTRIMILLIFLLCFIGGITLDEIWTRPLGRRLYWTRLATAGCFAVSLGAVVAWIWLGDVSPTFIRSTAISGVIALGIGLLTLYQPDKASKHQRLWQYLVITWLALDLIIGSIDAAPTIARAEYDIFTNKQGQNTQAEGRIFISAEDEQWLRHKRFYRFKDFSPLESFSDAFLIEIANTNALIGVDSVSNFDPLLAKRYQDWMESIPMESGLELQADLLRMGAGSHLVRDPKSSYLHTRAVDDAKMPSLARFVPCAQIASNYEEARSLVGENKTNLNLVVIETAVANSLPECGGIIGSLTGNISHFERVGNNINIEYTASQNGVLVVSYTYYPGWVARLDGKKADLYPADGVFWAIFAPGGEHRVEFTYEPVSFRIGLLVTILSLGAFSLLIRKRLINQ